MTALIVNSFFDVFSFLAVHGPLQSFFPVQLGHDLVPPCTSTPARAVLYISSTGSLTSHHTRV